MKMKKNILISSSNTKIGQFLTNCLQNHNLKYIDEGSLDYKNTANKVLKKLKGLGYEINDLDKYLKRKTLINKKAAEAYMDKLRKTK